MWYLWVALIFLAACDSGSAGDAPDASASVSQTADGLKLVGVYEFGGGPFDCPPPQNDKVLTLYFNSDTRQFRATNLNGDVYLEGIYMEGGYYSFQRTYNATPEEIADCYSTVETSTCVPGSNVACHHGMLREECQSKSYYCTTSWYKK